MIVRMFERKKRSGYRCNKCGKEISAGGFLGISGFTMPYGSRHDYDTLNLNLCVDCLDALVDSCVINPVTEYSEKSDIT